MLIVSYKEKCIWIKNNRAMNRNVFFCIFAILSILCACSREDDVESCEISIENAYPILDAEANEISIDFYASAKWTIDASKLIAHKDWLYITPTRGNKGSNSLIVSVTENQRYTERQASITITCGDVEKEIVIKQKANTYTNFNTISLDASGDSFSVRIVGYEDFTIDCNQEWCTANKDINNNQTYLKIVASANDEETRYAQITLKSLSGKELFQITVKQFSFAEQENVQSAIKEIKTTERSSLFLLFTATWCPYTPIMQKAFELASDSYAKNIELVNVHIKESELYCELSTALSTYYENNTTPTGILDGRVKILNTSLDAITVSQSILNKLKEGETFIKDGAQIKVKGGLFTDEIIVDIGLNNLEVSAYNLQVWLLEDKLEAQQECIVNGYYENYIHNNILRGTLSSILGDEFVVDENSSAYKEFSYTYSVPNYCNKENLRLLIILSKKANVNNTTMKFPYYVDNCFSVPLIDYSGGANIGGNENILPGEDIEL